MKNKKKIMQKEKCKIKEVYHFAFYILHFDIAFCTLKKE